MAQDISKAGTTQTAVQWLEQEFMKGNIILPILFQKAKAMEKEQISKAWNDGNYAYFYSKETGRDFDNGEQYYNETYIK